MNQRISYLDGIRGFSIVGILLVNITSFSWPELYDSSPSLFWNNPVERLLHSFFLILVQSNFYPIFALLFGISIHFVFESAVKKGFKPYRILSKRMIFLFFIGAAHGFFIWYGDILMVYAILGLFLLPFYHFHWKTLLLIGLCLWIIPNGIYGGLLYLTKATLVPFNNSSAIQAVIKSYQSGKIEAFTQNITDWHLLYNMESMYFIFISIIPMFLIGLSIAKGNLLKFLTEKHSIVNKLWIVAAAIGFSLKCLRLINPNNLLFAHISEAFGGPLLGVFYCLTIIKFYSNTSKLQKVLSYIGRMSLSNYLFQSLMGVFLFKGLGFYGDSSPLINLLISLVIIVLQLVISRYWLQLYKLGPVESIWRKATYGFMIKEKHDSFHLLK